MNEETVSRGSSKRSKFHVLIHPGTLYILLHEKGHYLKNTDCGTPLFIKQYFFFFLLNKILQAMWFTDKKMMQLVNQYGTWVDHPISKKTEH